MIQKPYIFLLTVILIIVLPEFSFGQGGYTLINSGTINNSKTGVIKINKGQVKGLPDSIGGRVEFNETYPMNTQEVPNIIFNQLVLKNPGQKVIVTVKTGADSLSPLKTVDSLIVDSSAYVLDNYVDIHAKASVKNTATLLGKKDVRLVNDSVNQEIQGKGQFSNLNIDNPKGVDVIKDGGFKVNSKLELTRGQLRNNSQNNFSLGDSSLIVRHVGASLQEKPQFEGNVSVRYVGSGSLTAGPEVPDDSSKLLDLSVETTEGMYMANSFSVNRNLFAGSSIFTEPGDTTQYILTLKSENNPIYGNPDAEVYGSLRRTNLPFGSNRIVFNNPYTYAVIPDAASANNMSEMTIRMKQHSLPNHPNSANKVKRYFDISAKDNRDSAISTGVNFTIGYGWRHSKDNNKNESNNLDITRVILQRWANNKWFNEQSSVKPAQKDDQQEWAYSYATTISALGSFAIGLASSDNDIYVNVKVFLEGPYRYGEMSHDLRDKGLIPNQPPRVYPYTLDPNYDKYYSYSIPENAVDWILLEFRNKLKNDSSTFVTGFLLADGSVVHQDSTKILIAEGDVNPGKYDIIIRHRNHLSVITNAPQSIYPDNGNVTIDFARNPDLVFPDRSSMKRIGYDYDNNILFGLFAGDVNGDGVIDDPTYSNPNPNKDVELIWDSINQDGYLISDINMDGIVSTRDLNFSWNNRGKKFNK